ncbi:hypothetical protein D3C87_105560 [compost metagenome]
MNFDKLKDDWNNNEPVSTEVSENMLKLKEASTPIDQIRKKMKHDFFWQLAFLIIMTFVPKIFGFSEHLKITFIVFYSILCGFTAYYFFKFYIFYKHSYDLGLDSRNNLIWFYYEMKLNVELYKALTYISVFITLSFFATALYISKNDELLRILDKLSIVYVVLNVFITIVIVGIITELWAKYLYGKYLKQLKTIIDCIDEE